ncbi:MAG: hypothetical protein P9M06_05535 [Candidatus Saelkia tenebricola]|nr:hypothetical protein [Candidatus Saelkia tenebricola]
MFISFFCFFVLFVFIVLQKKSVQKEDIFYLAGGNTSSLLLSMTLLATILGASSTIGLIGLAYRVGLPGSLWLIIGSIGLFMLALIYQKYVFPIKIFTLPEFFGATYGRNVKKITSIIIVIAWTGVISAQILAMGKIFEIFFPSYASTEILLFSTFILILYTAAGGQSAVIFTDSLQLIFLLIGIVGINFTLFLNPGFVVSSINPEYLRFPLNDYFSLTDLIYFLIVLGSAYLIGPDIHSRLFCASSLKIRKKALRISAFLLIPIGFLISLIGVLSHHRFGSIMPDQVLPLLINEAVNFKPLKYLFLLALVSALFSSADTCLLTSSTILIRDIFNLRKKKAILFTRWSIFFIGFLAYFLSIYFNQIIKVLLASYSIYASGLLLPFLLIPFKEKLKIANEAVFFGILMAGGTALVSNIFEFRLGIYLSYLLSVGGIFLISYLKRSK